jgi:hypothetical protein
MLNSLSYIYQSHGIKFFIFDMQKVLLRLLTPFELLSYFHIVDNDDMIDKASDNYWQFKSKIKNIKSGLRAHEIYHQRYHRPTTQPELNSETIP